MHRRSRRSALRSGFFDRAQIGGFLRRLGHELRLARTARAGAAALDAGGVDTVVRDLTLPGLDGLEFLRLRQLHGLPVVVIAPSAARDQAAAYLQSGAFEFLTKPLSFEFFEQVIRYAEMRVAQGPTGLRSGDQRRSPRLALEVPVQVAEFGRPGWRGASVSLSVFGAKIRPDTPLSPGAAVVISFTPPDGGPPLHLLSLLLRADPDGYAFRLVNLRTEEFERLRNLLDRLAAVPAPD